MDRQGPNARHSRPEDGHHDKGSLRHSVILHAGALPPRILQSEAQKAGTQEKFSFARQMATFYNLEWYHRGSE